MANYQLITYAQPLDLGMPLFAEERSNTGCGNCKNAKHESLNVPSLSSGIRSQPKPPY